MTSKRMGRPVRAAAEDTPVARLRAERGWSQMQMAQLFGVTHSTISRWEKGAMALSGPAKKILEKYMENKNRLLMNPHTGSVDTEENWRADFESMTPEERGADTFEGCGLIEVEPDGDGWWREVV